MPWRCPACQVPIQHGLGEDRPKPGGLYRCHVCRLELVCDPQSDKLTVAPFPEEPPAKTQPTPSVRVQPPSEDQLEELYARIDHVVETASRHRDKAGGHMRQADDHLRKAQRLKSTTPKPAANRSRKRRSR